ncbi:MFS transporter [Amycolatopsis pigmentata]|uniref:MFS transporter n=1 Tax=Amycolatopsis pigmentata TaxID=450801 RepID=A0ABW5GA80_9PSEU
MTTTRLTTETGRRSATVTVSCFSLASLTFSASQSLVAPALGTIAHDLHATTGDVSWVLTAYLLAASILTPVFGRLADIIGKRRVLVVTLLEGRHEMGQKECWCVFLQ